MGRAHAIVSTALLDRLKCEEAFARQIDLLAEKPWCDHTYYVEIASPGLADGYHGVQDIIIEGDSVRFKRDCDV
jgi:hypothetical protein